MCVCFPGAFNILRLSTFRHARAFLTYVLQVSKPMTLTEKIIAKACDRPSVAPNDNVWVKTDVLMTHDVCGPGTIGNFYKEFGATAKVRSGM